jgi:CheY-like chemotaxis protein
LDPHTWRAERCADHARVPTEAKSQGSRDCERSEPTPGPAGSFSESGQADMKDTFRILVADSNRNVREFLRRELVSQGYEVRVSGNSPELLSIIETDGLLDLLILDPDLPLLDEEAVCAHLDGRLPPLPMILHGYGEDRTYRSLLPFVCAFVEREGDVETLKDAVARVLASWHPQRFRRLCPQHSRSCVTVSDSRTGQPLCLLGDEKCPDARRAKS